MKERPILIYPENTWQFWSFSFSVYISISDVRPHKVLWSPQNYSQNVWIRQKSSTPKLLKKTKTWKRKIKFIFIIISLLLLFSLSAGNCTDNKENQSDCHHQSNVRWHYFICILILLPSRCSHQNILFRPILSSLVRIQVGSKKDWTNLIQLLHHAVKNILKPPVL